MASDAAYTAFLEQANSNSNTQADPGEQATTTTTTPSQTGTDAVSTMKSVDDGVVVPEGLKGITTTFISEGDEKFEPVALKWSGGRLPNATQFCQLVCPDTDQAGCPVKLLLVDQWDPKGQYADVVGLVEGYVRGEARVYEIVRGTRRVFYVVGLGREGGAVLGVRALGVES
ncbi:MAG: hypothetical protein M1824_002038 [Vezdaea acicularis]|nr:MAG: hypothetical protein M1824_002038 [Vezdaea acicularis]